jgi:hypothetical protein
MVLLFLNIENDMPKFAVIENGKVVNIVVAESDYAAQQNWVALLDNAGIDWDYTNGQFIDNRPLPKVVAIPAPSKEELLLQLNAISAQIKSLT